MDDGVSYFQRIAHVVAPSSDRLLDGSIFFPGASREQHVSKYILRLISDLRGKALNRLTQASMISQDFHTADFILAGSRSVVGAIFAHPFSTKRRDTLTPEEYIHFVRFFLGLPPMTTVGNASIHPDYDYPVQPCLAHPGSVLDAQGCHASACSSSFSARNHKHDHTVRGLAGYGREAGLNACIEPSSHSLLLGEYDQEQCRSILPTKITEAYNQTFLALECAMEHIDRSEGSYTPDERKAVIDYYAKAMPPVDKRDMKGLRVDLSLTDPTTGEEKWLDVSLVHTAAPTYAKAEAAFVALQQETLACVNPSAPSLPLPVSPALLQREQEKRKKYSRLTMIASRQFARGARLSKPTFAPVVISSVGDLAPDAVATLEWIVSKYKARRIAEHPRADGQTVKELTEDFRNRLYVHIMSLVAVGNQCWPSRGDPRCASTSWPSV